MILGVWNVGNYRRIGAVLFILVFLSVGIWYVAKGVSGNISKETANVQEKDVAALQDNAVFLEEKAKASNLEFRVKLLEKALAPKTPDEAVQKWAEGVKTRNGALQFAMFSPEVKEKELSSFEKLGGWITGQSSPWVESYDISKGIPKAQDSFQFVVKLSMVTSAGKNLEINNVIVQRDKDIWYVSEIQNEDGRALIP